MEIVILLNLLLISLNLLIKKSYLLIFDIKSILRFIWLIYLGKKGLSLMIKYKNKINICHIF